MASAYRRLCIASRVCVTCTMIAKRERRKSTNAIVTTYWYYKKVLAQQVRDDLCHDIELKLGGGAGYQLKSVLEVDDPDEDEETGEGAPDEGPSPAPKVPEAGPSSAGSESETWGQGAGTQPTSAGGNA